MQEKTSTKFYLDVDDFGFLLPGIDDMLRLKKHWPGFKMTCMTVPLPKEFYFGENAKYFTNEKYKKWAKMVNDLGFIEIGLHGFSHTMGEFDCKYQHAGLQLKAAEALFEEVGLRYKKIFRAPYWQYSYDSLMALKDRGYVVCANPENPCAIPPGTKIHAHNWSFERPLPDAKVIKGHGHSSNTERVKNSLATCYENMAKVIPKDAEFGFLSELYGI